MCEQKLSVFSADYWRAARRELNNPRVLAFSGLVCAMAIVLESLPIYLLGPSLKIYFSFLAVSLGCMCYGPVVGMMAGAIIDTVGFLLAGYGEPYFPGYLITAMLSGLIYGVMLYRQKTDAAAHYCDAAHHQLRQQRPAGQRLEGDALRQGLPLLFHLGSGKEHDDAAHRGVPDLGRAQRRRKAGAGQKVYS